MPLRSCRFILLITLLAGRATAAPAAGPDRGALAPLQERIAADLRAGRPLLVTVHVALCDNRVIRCGNRRLGDGDAPRGNLYWGGAAGLRAYFDLRRGYRRIHLDGGDGRRVLERVVYQRRVRPSAAWRRRGVKQPFELLLVAQAYRGTQIAQAMRRFIADVSGEAPLVLELRDGRRIAAGGAGHVVGYAGHNHLMDVASFAWPGWRRQRALGYFALACRTAPYLGPHLSRAPARALLLTRVLMYPGAFTIEGLLAGLAAGEGQREVFRRGADLYAHYQKRKPSLIRAAFTHDGRRSFQRSYGPAK